MDVRCEKCNTEYDFDDARITEAGVTVKCTQCGFVFKVKKRGTGRPAPSLVDELPPELSNVDKTREWKIRQLSGNIYTCRELTTLQKWIVERKVSREDEISLTGDTWKRLGNIPELAGFFIVVDQAARAAVYEQQIQSGVPLVPSAPTMLAAPPARPTSNPMAPAAYARPEAAWSGLAEPAEPMRRKRVEEEVPPEEQAPDEDDLAAIRGSHPGRWIVAGAALALSAIGGYVGYTTYAHREAPAPPVAALPTTPPTPPPPAPKPGEPQTPAGTPAPTGAVAATGPTGPVGTTAPSGPSGATAPTGPVAAVGATGVTGRTGSTAPTGATGATGAAAPTSVAIARKPEGEKAPASPEAMAEAAPRPKGEVKPERVEKAPRPEKPEAVAAADRPAPKSGASFEALMRQGRSLQKADKARKALEVFMQAIDAHPNSAEAWVGKGECLYDLDRAGEAEDAFKQALGFAPGYGDASLGLAQAYKSQGKKDEAIKAYQAYLAGSPNGENAEIARRNLKDLSE